jgi:hypothetical protein
LGDKSQPNDQLALDHHGLLASGGDDAQHRRFDALQAHQIDIDRGLAGRGARIRLREAQAVEGLLGIEPGLAAVHSGGVGHGVSQLPVLIGPGATKLVRRGVGDQQWRGLFGPTRLPRVEVLGERRTR